MVRAGRPHDVRRVPLAVHPQAGRRSGRSRTPGGGMPLAQQAVLLGHDAALFRDLPFPLSERRLARGELLLTSDDEIPFAGELGFARGSLLADLRELRVPCDAERRHLAD